MFDLFIVAIFSSILFNVETVDRPLVIGHRGTAYLPELTLATQSMSHAYGADLIEIDVCLSRDDQLIVIHGKISFRMIRENSCLFLSQIFISMP